MKKKEKTTVIERKGVNYIRSIIEADNCIYHEVHGENDYGIDAFLEFIQYEEVKGRLIALQIKSGSSYCRKKNCIIPATEDHYEYWKQHSLPVIGIVYNPDNRKAFWIDISKYITDNPKKPYQIKIIKTELTLFSDQNFREILKPLYLDKSYKVSLERSISFAKSVDYAEHSFGIHLLLRKYANMAIAWKTMFELFKEKKIECLDPNIVHYLSHIPWHPNISWHGEESITPDIEKDFKKTISNFSEADIIKMIQLFNKDNFISFDTYGNGWVIEALVSLIDNKELKLLNLISQYSFSQKIQNTLLFLYIHYEGKDGLRKLKKQNIVENTILQLLALEFGF